MSRPPPRPGAAVRLTAFVQGRVQGMGFRTFVAEQWGRARGQDVGFVEG